VIFIILAVAAIVAILYCCYVLLKHKYRTTWAQNNFRPNDGLSQLQQQQEPLSLTPPSSLAQPKHQKSPSKMARKLYLPQSNSCFSIFQTKVK
jgi:hypothetical protein